MTARSLTRVFALVAAAFALAALGPALMLARGGPNPSSDSSQAGWKTIEHGDVRVDVPSEWQLLDTADCQFHVDRWAPPGSSPCAFEEGLAFYGSATFDPAHGPGVRRTMEDGRATWRGYVYAGDFAVYAADRDRILVQAILDSARTTEG